MTQRILVWDLPTRFFHWLLVLNFTGAFLTAESERWRDLHVLFGYTVLGLIAFRLVWGFVGTRYVRLGGIIRSSTFVISYLANHYRRHVWRPVGYNPAGAVAILSLLSLGVGSGVSGWAVYEGIGSDWLAEMHDFISNAMLAMVFVHIAGVLSVSYMQRENLVVAMVTGKKWREDPEQAISNNHRLVAVLLLVALVGFWAWAWPESKNEGWFRAMGRELIESVL